MVACAGSGQDQYGEGYGDLNGVMISDDPILGYGFYLNVCDSGIRTAANTHQYPCSGEIHDCGQLLTGCWWSTRNIMVSTDPSTYRDLLSSWAVNSLLVHTGGSITPQITIDVLTLDDNNADITDGTPHYSQIAQGFGDHNMDAPPIDPFNFAYPSGKPTNISATGGSTVDVQVTPKGSFVLSNVKMHVDPESDGTYAAVNASPVGGGVYRATFPAATCGNTVNYYFSATATSGAVETDPATAPAATFSAFAGNGLSPFLSDTFETDLGWVASGTATAGAWVRTVPSTGGADHAPPADADGSGKCFVTGAGSGVDVDSGTAVLTSMTFDATNHGEVYAEFARWYYFNGLFGNETFTIELSNNNGATWAVVETIPKSDSSQSWITKRYQLSKTLPLTSQMKVRFTVFDTGMDSTVESGIDAFKLLAPDCGSPCVADFNNDGYVNGNDYDDFADAFDSGSMSADLNHDGYVNGNDYDLFAEHFDAGC